MNIKLIKSGMKLRVKTDISATEKKWTLDSEGEMKNMRGKIYKINLVDQDTNQVTLYDPVSDEYWVFCSEDLSSIIETAPIDPVMFDPESIFE